MTRPIIGSPIVGYARSTDPAVVRLGPGTYKITACLFFSPAVSPDTSNVLLVSDRNGWMAYHNDGSNAFHRTLSGTAVGQKPVHRCVETTTDYYFFARTEDSIIEFIVEQVEERRRGR